MIDPFNFVVGTAWGTFSFFCWSVIVRSRWRKWRTFRDARSRRELLFTAPLWAISVAWAIVLFLSVTRDVVDVGPVIRGLLFGIGVGMYTVAGLFGAIGGRK